jgi:hypothetical protein
MVAEERLLVIKVILDLQEELVLLELRDRPETMAMLVLLVLKFQVFGLLELKRAMVLMDAVAQAAAAAVAVVAKIVLSVTMVQVTVLAGAAVAVKEVLLEQVAQAGAALLLFTYVKMVPTDSLLIAM